MTNFTLKADLVRPEPVIRVTWQEEGADKPALAFDLPLDRAEAFAQTILNTCEHMRKVPA